MPSWPCGKASRMKSWCRRFMVVYWPSLSSSTRPDVDGVEGRFAHPALEVDHLLAATHPHHGIGEDQRAHDGQHRGDDRAGQVDPGHPDVEEARDHHQGERRHAGDHGAADAVHEAEPHRRDHDEQGRAADRVEPAQADQARCPRPGARPGTTRAPGATGPACVTTQTNGTRTRLMSGPVRSSMPPAMRSAMSSRNSRLNPSWGRRGSRGSSHKRRSSSRHPTFHVKTLAPPARPRG